MKRPTKRELEKKRIAQIVADVRRMKRERDARLKKRAKKAARTRKRHEREEKKYRERERAAIRREKPAKPSRPKKPKRRKPKKLSLRERERRVLRYELVGSTPSGLSERKRYFQFLRDKITVQDPDWLIFKARGEELGFDDSEIRDSWFTPEAS